MNQIVNNRSEAIEIIEEIKSNRDVFGLIEELIKHDWDFFEQRRDDILRAIRERKYVTKPEFDKMVSMAKCNYVLGAYPLNVDEYLSHFFQLNPLGSFEDYATLANNLELKYSPFILKMAFNKLVNKSAYVNRSPFDSLIQAFIEEWRLTCPKNTWIGGGEIFKAFENSHYNNMRVNEKIFGKLLKGLDNYDKNVLVKAHGYNERLDLWYKKTPTNTQYMVKE